MLTVCLLFVVIIIITVISAEVREVTVVLYKRFIRKELTQWSV